MGLSPYNFENIIQMGTTTTSSNKPLGVIALAMISVAAIFSLRNLPVMAEYGLSSAVFYLLAALVFFVPASLVCAELATTWPKNGGIYLWVKEALGPRFGFLTLWFEWTNTIVWFPAVLSYIAATLAYLIAPTLAANKYYMIVMMLGIFWGVSGLNYFGMRLASWVSGFGIVFGTLVPAVLILGLGIVWLLSGQVSQISFNWGALVPHVSLDQSAFLAGLILSFAGMQIAGFHAQDTANPQRVFPRAILLAVVLIVIASTLGTLAIAVVIPQQQISIVAGLMQTFDLFFTTFHLHWLVPVLALLTAFGSIASVNAWLTGPSKGLQYAAQESQLPQVFHSKNRYGMPAGILTLQALIGTVLSLVYLFLPTVNASYWFLSALTAQLTMFMYLLLFVAVIVLRYRHPDVARPYRIPGGKIGVWLAGGLGFAVSLATIVLGFIPPAQLETGSTLLYETALLGGILAFSLPALVLFYRQRKRDS